MATGTVREIFRMFTPGAESVTPEAPLEVLAERMARDRGSRAVSVMGPQGELVGIVRLEDVLRWLGAQYTQERGFGQARNLFAATARDLMVEPVSVGLDDPVEAALRVAVQHQIEDIPVVDADGRVIGQVDGFELLVGLSALAQG